MSLRLGAQCRIESNIMTNVYRKKQKYVQLIRDQQKKYEVKFINLCVSSLGVFSESSQDFIKLLIDFKFDAQYRKYIMKRIMTTCIRTSYFIFCRRNKEWHIPELMKL